MTYPVDPNGKQRKPGPHLAIGIIVILLGTAMGITGLAVGVTKVVHDFSGTVYTAPGSVHSHLTPGTCELFQAVDGSHRSRPVQGSGVTGGRVTDSGGTTVGIFR